MREAPFFHDFCIVTSKNMKTNNKNGREASENFENGVFSSLHFYYHRFKFTTTDFSPKTATTTDLYYHVFFGRPKAGRNFGGARRRLKKIEGKRDF